MALTLDGTTTLPMMGGTTGGVGMGALGGGVVGLLLGGLLSNKNGGLFGGGNNNDNVQYESLQAQISALNSSAEAAAIEASIGRVQTQVGGLATEQAAANFTTLSSINGLGRDILASQNQIQLQQLNSFNNLQFQNATATNQIISQGTANAQAMANCCCEIKGAILADGSATRALINDLNVQNLRDQLAAANGKVSNNEQNQYLLNSILTHLHPVTTSTAVVV